MPAQLTCFAPYMLNLKSTPAVRACPFCRQCTNCAISQSMAISFMAVSKTLCTMAAAQ